MANIQIIQGDFEQKLKLQFAPGIKAGFPSPAEDYNHETLDFNRDLIQNPEATFYGRVEGDSMIEAGSMWPCDPERATGVFRAASECGLTPFGSPVIGGQKPHKGRRRPSEERLNVFPCLMRGAISPMATEGKASPHSRRRTNNTG